MATRTYWVVEEYTNARLLYADGTVGVSESAGRVLSRHRTESKAAAARAKCLRINPLSLVRVVRKAVAL